MKPETLTTIGLACAVPLASAAIGILWSLNNNVVAINGKIDSLTERAKSQQEALANHDSRLRTLEFERP